MFVKVKFYLFLFIIFNCQFNYINTDENKNDDNILQYRLPNNTAPINYNIEITTEIDKDNFKFYGISKISLVPISSNTNYISIHTKQSKLGEIKVKNLSDNKYVEIIETNYNNITEILNIILIEALNSTSIYELTVPYNSTLREDNLGFYRSSYKNDEGKEIWLAATQFAPTEARHAFPCYDEPQIKTSFTIQITHPIHLEAISNMESTATINNSDKTKTSIFKTTPVMSTYLVGFVISDFDKNISNKNIDFQHEIYVRKNAMKYTKFAGNFGEQSFGKLLDYFNIEPQPIKIMKQVALPDFHFSGMENWGIVTYKETVLFYRSSLHGSKRLLDLSSVMGHEMSHQWFGNLVTHKWWTYVWLKEGFSTLYGNYVIDMLYPHWKYMEHYQIKVMHFVFGIDQDSSIRPMTYYVEKQLDIRKNYDKIAYEKSSCVLRMFDHALNQKKEIFKKGVDFYLSEMKYRAATEEDLFRSLDKALHAANEPLNISETLGIWTSQGGYPVIHVSVNNDEIEFRQERFFDVDGTDNKALWHIPINFEIENGNNFNDTSAKFWMKQRKLTFTIGSHLDWNSEQNWIIVNVQQTGYYRVNYDSANWHLLIGSLLKNHTNIHTHNRAQLIDDAFNLARVNKLSYNIVFELLEYLKDERDYAPWAAFNNGIELLKLKISQTKYYNNFQKFMKKILLPAFKDFGVTKISNEIPLISMTRQIIAQQSCDIQLEECIHNTLNFSILDMRPVYYSMKLKKKDKTILFQLKNLLKNTDDSFVRADYISSLGYFEDKKVLTLLLWHTVQNTEDFKLDKTEKSLLLKTIYKNSDLGLELSLNFILSNWSDLKDNLPEDSLNGIIEDISNRIHKEDHITIFNQIIRDVNIAKNSLQKCKQNIIKSLEWDLLYTDVVTEWLNDKYFIDVKSKSGLLVKPEYLLLLLTILSLYILNEN